MVAADTRVAPAPKSAKTVARAKRWATAAVALAVAAAFVLGAVVALLQARADGSRLDRPRAAGRWAVAGGVLAGVALLYRIDLGLAVALAGMAVVWGLRAPLVRRAVVGAAIGLSPYLL